MTQTRRTTALLACLAIALTLAPADGPAQVPRPILPSASAVLDWAELAYPTLFPGHPPQRVLAPYLYRHYPASGNYLGIAGNGIWLLGPAAGGGANPVHVGDHADLACQVYPASCLQVSSFPERAIELVVPTAAGGPTDLLGRRLAAAMSSVLGVAAQVRNVTGQNTLTGTQAVAAAAPTGHTTLLHTVALASNTGAYRNPGAAVPGSFAFLGLVAESPLVLVTPASNSGETLQSLLARALAQPGSVSVGHGVTGSVTQLCALMLQQHLGLSLRLVAHSGTAPVLNDLIDRRLDLACLESHSVVPYVQAGQLRALATTGPQRSSSPQLNAMPTLLESTANGFSLTAWVGLSVPAATPAVVRERLNAALRTAAGSVEFAQQLSALASEPITDHRAGEAGHLAYATGQAQSLGDVFRRAGVTAD